MPTINYITVDVFTSSRFAGNPLAVIPDARGLSTQDMQNIAKEFNYSESTFVFPPSDPANTAQVRIFTPSAEMPFAGHPNVGTAFVLGQLPTLFGVDMKAKDEFIFEEKAGLVPVKLRRSASGGVTSATIRAPGPLTTGPVIPVGIVAGCASVKTEQVRTSEMEPLIASVGLAFAFAELTDLDALAAAQPNVTAFHEADKTYGKHAEAFPLFLYVRDEKDPWKIRARMFGPLDGVTEDPATGSASAALGALLVSRAKWDGPDGTVSATVEQGVEMGRRSIIQLEVRRERGEVKEVFVTGECVEVMRGGLGWEWDHDQ